MAERDRTVDELLEQSLRALPDVEPPAGLADRVMAEILADEAEYELLRQRTPRQRQKGPMGRRGLIPVKLTIAVAAAFTAIASLLLTGSADAWIRLLVATGQMSANVVQFVVDLSVTVVMTGWLLLDQAVTVTGVFVTVMRTIVDAVVAEAGSFIIAAVGVGVGLQLVLLTIVRHRPESP